MASSKVTEKSLSRAEKNKLMKDIRKVMNGRIKIPRNETDEARHVLEPLIDKVLQCAAKVELFKSMKRLNTGSQYEKLKIMQSDEFDIMFYIEDEENILECIEQRQAPGFLQLKFDATKAELKRSKWKDVCTTDGFLSSKKMRKYFKENVVDQAVEDYGRRRSTYKVSVVEESKSRKECSPAVTVTVERRRKEYSVDLVLAVCVGPLGRFRATRGWNDGGTWLRKADERGINAMDVYAVAKSPPPGLGMDTRSIAKTWRLSFSKVEKKLLLQADSASRYGETCRKECYRICKFILHKLKEENLRMFSSLYTYHLKTAFLHYCAEMYKYSQWKKEPNVEADRVMGLLEYFIGCIKDKSLPNFFVPRSNLIGDFDRTTLNGIARRIQEKLDLIRRGEVGWMTRE
ncbi:cyclic GMP-AMP synthase-like [Ptychodera flava]|uniref:cyclic GMP-AMP synthase-like n=1 Tax=Ptychodera flava TaxID=63121 RepID=UPI00396A0598